MNEFEKIKESVSIRQVAEMYGCNVNKSGFCCCPFHNEKTPSMKLYEKNDNFYCFGCGEKGDVIDFTAKLFGLPVREAAKKLDSDIGIGAFSTEKTMTKSEFRADLLARQREREEQKAEEQWIKNALAVVNEYGKVLDKFKKLYVPNQQQSTEINPLFFEAINNKNNTDYLFECLLKEPHEVYTNNKKEIENIALRLKDIMQQGLHKIQPVANREIDSKNQTHDETKHIQKGMNNHARR